MFALQKKNFIFYYLEWSGDVHVAMLSWLDLILSLFD